MNCPYGGLYNGIVEDSDNTVNMVRHDNKYVGSDMLNTRGEFLPIGWGSTVADGAISRDFYIFC